MWYSDHDGNGDDKEAYDNRQRTSCGPAEVPVGVFWIFFIFIWGGKFWTTSGQGRNSYIHT